jgi:hypothetical protein
LGFSWRYGFNSSMAPLGGSLAMLIPLAVLPIVSILTRGEEDVSLCIREKRTVGNTGD